MPTPRSIRPNVLPAAAFSALLAACGIANAAVFEDTFTSGANWAKFTGNDPVLATTYQPTTNSGSGWTKNNTTLAQSAVPAAVAVTAIQLNNSAVEANIGQTVTGDWTLNAKLLSSSYGRTQQVGFTDIAGNGYSFALNAGNPNQYGVPTPGMGSVTIRRTSLWAGSAAPFSNTGTVLGALVDGNHWLTGYAVVQPAVNPNGSAGSTVDPIAFDTNFVGYADFKLSWTAATGELNVWEDDVLLATRTDTTFVPGVAGFTGFSRIALGGNTVGSFDYISVSVVPEPTILAPALMGAAILLRRRKSA